MIFQEQSTRKPDLYPFAKTFIEVFQDNFWTHREFNFSSDIQDFKVKLTDQERTVVVRALSSIGQLELSVKKFWAKLGDNLPHPSLIDMGFVLANSETIHSGAYEALLEILDIEDAFDKILETDIMKSRVNYLKKHLHKFHADNKKQFVYSLILFTLFVENISLFAQFYTIGFFGRYKNLLKDTNKQIEYTSVEENLHAQVGIKLINVIKEEYPELFDEELRDKVLYEAEQAVLYECEIINWILDGYSDKKLNPELLHEFIKNRLNNSLEEIGYNKVFEVNKDLLEETQWFNEQILGTNKTDFFHSKPTEYAKRNQSFNEEDIFE